VHDQNNITSTMSTSAVDYYKVSQAQLRSDVANSMLKDAMEAEDTRRQQLVAMQEELEAAVHMCQAAERMSQAARENIIQAIELCVDNSSRSNDRNNQIIDPDTGLPVGEEIVVTTHHSEFLGCLRKVYRLLSKDEDDNRCIKLEEALAAERQLALLRDHENCVLDFRAIGNTGTTVHVPAFDFCKPYATR
jgi:hypothetical protein